MYKGNTYMIAKGEGVITDPKNLRPITCLSVIFKLITKIVTGRLTEFVQANDVISENQMGAKKHTLSAKESALINNAININNKDKLRVAWIDVKKAYDSVRHPYLLDVLRKFRIPRYIYGFISRILEKQAIRIN